MDSEGIWTTFHWGSLEKEMECYERGEIDDPYFHQLIVDRINKERWEAEYTEKLIKEFGRDPRILDNTKLCRDCRWAFRGGRWKVRFGDRYVDDVRCGRSLKKYKNVLTGEVRTTAELCELSRRWFAANYDACLPIGRHWKPKRPGDTETSFDVLGDDDPKKYKLWATLELHVKVGDGIDEEDVKVCTHCRWCNPGMWHGLVPSWDADLITCSKFQITEDSAVRGKVNRGNPLCKQVRHPTFAKDDMRCKDGEHWIRRR